MIIGDSVVKLTVNPGKYKLLLSENVVGMDFIDQFVPAIYCDTGFNKGWCLWEAKNIL